VRFPVFQQIFELLGIRCNRLLGISQQSGQRRKPRIKVCDGDGGRMGGGRGLGSKSHARRTGTAYGIARCFEECPGARLVMLDTCHSIRVRRWVVWYFNMVCNA
jgi:hypothetical protein